LALRDPFRYFNHLPEMIPSAVLLYIRYPLSLRKFKDLLFERGVIFTARRFGSGGSGLPRCSLSR